MAQVKKLLEQAVAALQKGQYAKVSTYCRKVLTAQPKSADAKHILAIAYHRQGESQKALKAMQQAIQFGGEQAQFYNTVGMIYAAGAYLSKAHSSFGKAIKCDEQFIEAHHQLATVALREQDYQHAYQVMQQALAINEKAEPILANLSHIVHHNEMPLEQLDCIVKIFQLYPKSIRALLELSFVYYKLERFAQSRAMLQRVLEIDPGNARAHNNMATLLLEQGDTEQAAKHYEKAISNPQDLASAHHNYVQTRQFSAQDPERSRIEALLKQDNLSVDEQTKLHFALAKICDDAKLYDQAFASMQRGNQLKNKNYDVDLHAQRMEQTISLFDAQFFAERADWGEQQASPIFIVGMPRSGTTLVEQIIASHNQVYGAGEIAMIQTLLNNLPKQYPTLGDYPPAVGKLNKPQVAQYAAQYLQTVMQGKAGESRTTDKYLRNIEFLGFIYLLFPQARVIVCRRHPLDTCLSIYMQNFIADVPYESDLQAMATHYRLMDKLYQHWQKVASAALLTVEYEQLVADQEAQTRRLLEFCELSWDANCLDYHKNSRHIQTASIWQVRQPIYHSSVGRWQNYAKHLQAIESLLENNKSAQ